MHACLERKYLEELSKKWTRTSTVKGKSMYTKVAFDLKNSNVIPIITAI